MQKNIVFLVVINLVMGKWQDKTNKNQMKFRLSILFTLLCVTVFGQYGIISNKNRVINIHNSPKKSRKIIDTLKNGKIIFCLAEENEWYPIDYYSDDMTSKSGYIHKSNVKLISAFDNIPSRLTSDSIITFKNDSINIIITKRKFDPTKNKLEYHKGDSIKNEISWLEKINGTEIWGTDGNIPIYKYGEITFITSVRLKKCYLISDFYVIFNSWFFRKETICY